jgi:hypothetical protein
MKTIPIKTQRVNLDTGEATERVVHAKLMPARRGACPICDHYPAHAPDEPHNPQMLYYQYAFYGEHGRWPTWKDAIAHCPPDVQRRWEAELRASGAWSEPAAS